MLQNCLPNLASVVTERQAQVLAVGLHLASSAFESAELGDLDIRRIEATSQYATTAAIAAYTLGNIHFRAITDLETEFCVLKLRRSLRRTRWNELRHLVRLECRQLNSFAIFFN